MASEDMAWNADMDAAPQDGSIVRVKRIFEGETVSKAMPSSAPLPPMPLCGSGQMVVCMHRLRQTMRQRMSRAGANRIGVTVFQRQRIGTTPPSPARTHHVRRKPMAEAGAKQLAHEAFVKRYADGFVTNQDRRCGVMSILDDAAHMCDAIKADILSSGRKSKGRDELAAVAQRCGDAIWAMRKLIPRPDHDASGQIVRPEGER